MQTPKACFFDVFGTLVDWRSSIAREAEAILKPLGHSLDRLAFADAWRDEYQPAMEEIRSGRLAFCKLDILHRRNLERILPRFKIANLSEDVMRQLNLAWHRLDAWPDSAAGLARLKKKCLVAPVSIGNISLMVDLARRNNFPWDAILGSEIAGDFKPKPRVYLAACEAFDLPPGDCMMVAAHSSDLSHAAKSGLRTGHIARPNEHGPGKASRSQPCRSTPSAPTWKTWLPSWGRDQPYRENSDDGKSAAERCRSCCGRKSAGGLDPALTILR